MHMAFKGTSTIGTTDYARERVALERVDAASAALRAERNKVGRADPRKLEQLEEAFRRAQDEAGKFVVDNELDDAVERAGGRGLSFQGGWDSSTYTSSLPSNAIELWFHLESERFRDPVFRDFYKERDVVMEERRMRVENDPVAKLVEEFFAVAYKAHPYGGPRLGHMSDLENADVATARAIFDTYYVPSNLTAVIVGDVDPARVRRLAEAYFGRLAGGPKPPPLGTVEPPQEGERRVTLRLRAQREVLVGYHKPDITHPDHAVYDAISSLLSEGRSSRLHRALVLDAKVAVDAGGFPGLPGQKYPGLFLFYGVTAQGHTNAEVERAIGAEIGRLRTELVTKEELEGVKRRARANLVRQLEDNGAMARELASWQALTGDWRNLFRHLDRIDAVTPEAIQRVARVTFTPNNRIVGTVEPLEPGAAE
jgi:predicted Zn-dependent peptidase